MSRTAVARAAEAVRRLEAVASAKHRDGIVRYGIAAPRILGVPMAKIQALGREIGRDQDTASALWDTGVYEARLLAAYVGDPDRLTEKEAERWVAEFDNWAVCDTHCFVLFDRTEFAYAAALRWSRRKPEFERRAGFALMAGLAGHDRRAADEAFMPFVAACSAAADDARNFVKKGVSWALRRMGGRSRALHEECVAAARELAAADDAARRWVGKDVLKDLLRPTVAARVERAERKAEAARAKRAAPSAAKAAAKPRAPKKPRAPATKPPRAKRRG